MTDFAPTRIHTPTDTSRLSRAIKLTFDWAVALVALVLLSPFMLVIALAIALTSKGPILFRQTRIGRDGKPFTFYKFRTMVREAEHLRDDILEQNQCNPLLFKMPLDPRTTRVGRTLRRYSLDELPQIWHVLTGQMSLIGPRPALPSEVALYEPHVHRRHEVRPGLTGLWQVSGRSDLSWEEAVELDLTYIDDWSLGLDARILVRTVPAVLTGRGAY